MPLKYFKTAKKKNLINFKKEKIKKTKRPIANLKTKNMLNRKKGPCFIFLFFKHHKNKKTIIIVWQN